VLFIKKNGEIFIRWRIWWKQWHIRPWEEEKAKERCIFDRCYLSKKNGEIFIRWWIWWKQWYVRPGEEEKAEKIFVETDEISRLNEDEKWIYFEYKKWWLWEKKYVFLHKNEEYFLTKEKK